MVQGLPVSMITLGTVALGKNYGISNDSGKPSTGESEAVLLAAMQAGINTIDTANDYGTAEQLIGDFLENHKPRKQAVAVSKFKISSKNLNNERLAREEAYQSVLSSLKLLRLERLPVCLYHKEIDVPVERLMEILPPIFASMQNDGLINTAGVSVYHPDELKVFSKSDIFRAFQVPMNVFDHRLIHAGVLLNLFKEEKIVFIRSIFLQGLFFMPPSKLTGNLLPAVKYLGGLKNIADSEGISIAQLAFSFVRDTVGVTSLVFGAINAHQVKENVTLLNGPALSEKAIAGIEKLVAGMPGEIIIPGKWSL